MKNKPKQLVVKSNRLVEARHGMTLLEMRVLALCAIRIRDEDNPSEETEFTLTKNDYAGAFGADATTAYRDLYKGADKLKKRVVTIKRDMDAQIDEGVAPSNIVADVTISAVRRITTYKQRGKVGLLFEPEMLELMHGLKRKFTRYGLAYVAQLTSQYAFRFYELARKWLSQGHFRNTLMELREIFELENKYLQIHNFKARVLHPALKQINELTDINVTCEDEKSGREVVAFEFTVSLKAAKIEGPAKPKEGGPYMFGFPQSVLDKAGRPGESYAQVAARLRRELPDD